MTTGNFRFKFEYDFSIPVCRLYVITSHNNLIPEASFFTGKQHEEVRSLETSLVGNSKVVLDSWSNLKGPNVNDKSTTTIT